MAVIRTLTVTVSLDEDHAEVTDALNTLAQWVTEAGAEHVAQYAAFDPGFADEGDDAG